MVGGLLEVKTRNLEMCEDPVLGFLPSIAESRSTVQDLAVAGDDGP